jgi:hypothetical protein
METEDVRDSFDSPKNPVKVIRMKCRDCTNNSVAEIDNCTVKSCPLYPWRMGKNPYRIKKVMTEEQRAIAGARLAKARENKK